MKPYVPKWRKTCTGLKFDLLNFYGPQSNIHTFWDPTFFWLTLYLYSSDYWPVSDWVHRVHAEDTWRMPWWPPPLTPTRPRLVWRTGPRTSTPTPATTPPGTPWPRASCVSWDRPLTPSRPRCPQHCLHRSVHCFSSRFNYIKSGYLCFIFSE